VYDPLDEKYSVVFHHHESWRMENFRSVVEFVLEKRLTQINISVRGKVVRGGERERDGVTWGGE